MAILQDNASLLAEIERLKADNARLLAKRSTVSFKVSEKGALSVYGLGRFPVTLYRSQWERLMVALPQVKAFIEANGDSLKSKDD